MQRCDGRAGDGWRLLFAMLVAVVLAVTWIHHLLADPRVMLLQSKDGASWIRFDRRFNSAPWRKPKNYGCFRNSHFDPAIVQRNHVARGGVSRVKVQLDDRELFDSGPDLESWKSEREISIPARLPTGFHLLTCVVTNRGGPSLVRVSCPDLSIHTTVTGRQPRMEPIGVQPSWRKAHGMCNYRRVLPVPVAMCAIYCRWRFFFL